MSTSSVPVRVLVADAGAFGARLARRPDASLAGLADANPATLEPRFACARSAGTSELLAFRLASALSKFPFHSLTFR